MPSVRTYQPGEVVEFDSHHTSGYTFRGTVVTCGWLGLRNGTTQPYHYTFIQQEKGVPRPVRTNRLRPFGGLYKAPRVAA